MYLRQAGLTRNPTFSYLYSVRCRGQGAASEAPLERKYSRYAACLKNTSNYEEIVFHDDIYFDHDFSSRTGY